jgi:phosphatidate cytidylyltransferase
VARGDGDEPENGTQPGTGGEPGEGSGPGKGGGPAGGTQPGDGDEPGKGGEPENGSEQEERNQPSCQPGTPTASGSRRTGRNLPVALGVGIGLGGIALWELSSALGERAIRLPLVPVAAGGIAAVTLAYWQGERALVACAAVTVIAIFTWRMPTGTAGYLRDVTAGVFAFAYLPLMASFVSLMLAATDGSHRTLTFLILTVCSDVGGYFAGILTGRHLMTPVISPKKTWEGLGGSVIACVVGGAIALPTLLDAPAWRGAVVGAAAVIAATLGDLAESMIKRDLRIKDMGTVLPGHGGILDRIDSLLIAAPVVWLLLVVLVPPPH